MTKTEFNNKPLLRAFFAIMLPDSIQKNIQKMQHTLQQSLQDTSIRWISPENLHITLRFIHSLKAEDLPMIVEQIKKVFLQHHSFALRWGSLEQFPTIKNPKIISLQILRSKELKQAVRQINQVLSSHHYPDSDFSFRPHLTVARLKKPLDKVALSHYQHFSLPDLEVENIKLLESRTLAHGSQYIVIENFSLKHRKTQ